VTPLRCNFLANVYKINPEKIELLLLGVDDEKINIKKKEIIRQRIRASLGLSENDFVIITGGKIDEKKNTHLLIQSILEIQHETLKLIVFGTTDEKMKTLIENLCKSERIRNIGWIDSNYVYDYFMASDLAVFPGTHSVLWEQSVGIGIPGVFKYWTGMDHVDIGGNCKFLYKDQITEIKSILLQIFENPTLYNEMRENAEKGPKFFSYKEISLKSLQL
jgi:glycosyltransferase involved in cell wall biosynthesis